MVANGQLIRDSLTSSSMSAIRTITVATDFSFSAHRAARRAAALAAMHGASLKLVHVLDSSSAKALRERAPTIDVEQPLHLDAERSLESLAEDIAAANGVSAETQLREGRVMEEIPAAAASSDLLVLGARGINPIRDLILGSTAERIARMVVRPILVVKQDPQIPYDSVLVPVDFSDCSVPSLRFASELTPGAVLQVFHAVDSPLQGRLRSAGVAAESIEAYCAALQTDAEAKMTELLSGLTGHKVVPSVQASDPRVGIGERAAETGSALIVVGKQSRSWLSEHVLGSVSRTVLERAPCDVAVVPHS